MESNHYQIAIIGGGLAGLTLAIQSVQAGYKTVLFEKEEYPFHKVCGEYISLESWSFLEKLGVPLQQMKLPIIKHLQTSDIKGRLYHFNLPLGGFGISRYKLDSCLYELARAKGVDVLTNTKVNSVDFDNNCFRIQSNAGDYTAQIAAGCYGKRSNIDVRLKRPFLRQQANHLNNYIGVKYHINYNNSDTTIALHNFKNGYCGISKIEDNRSCFCYLTTEQNLQDNNNSIIVDGEECVAAKSCIKTNFYHC